MIVEIESDRHVWSSAMRTPSLHRAKYHQSHKSRNNSILAQRIEILIPFFFSLVLTLLRGGGYVTDPDEKNRLPDGSVRGGMYGGSGIPRMTSRSATATPTGSPKRRHLPQIPSALQQTSFARVRQVYQIKSKS